AVWKFLKVFKNNNVGFENLHSHQLRHSFATNAHLNDVPIISIKELLGHQDINTTTIYTHTPTAALKAMLSYREKKTFIQELKNKIFPRKETIIHIPQENNL
ncbi:MAG: tyrosine-type recombinase/integrase, partial [Flammeovirgaceae bacterium]